MVSDLGVDARGARSFRFKGSKFKVRQESENIKVANRNRRGNPCGCPLRRYKII